MTLNNRRDIKLKDASLNSLNSRIAEWETRGYTVVRRGQGAEYFREIRYWAVMRKKVSTT